eukprot:153105-Amphidinium_carterae.2
MSVDSAWSALWKALCVAQRPVTPACVPYLQVTTATASTRRVLVSAQGRSLLKRTPIRPDAARCPQIIIVREQHPSSGGLMHKELIPKPPPSAEWCPC